MNPYRIYQQTQAQTASPGELVVMLYRGCVRATMAGAEAIDRADTREAHTNLLRAQAILAELAATLDLERGGDLARNLAGLYDYLLKRLVSANLTKDASAAREVERFLRELLPAWEEATRVTAGRPVALVA